MSFWCHRFDQNNNENIVLDFCPEIFCSCLGASWKLFGASCRLPYKSYYLPTPQEAQKSYKKFQGRNIFVTILVETMTPKRHFEIKWPLTCLSKNIEIETGISLDLLKAINVPWPDITFFVATATLAKVLQTMKPDYLLACIWIFIPLRFLKRIFILHTIQHAHIDDI